MKTTKKVCAAPNCRVKLNEGSSAPFCVVHWVGLPDGVKRDAKAGRLHFAKSLALQADRDYIREQNLERETGGEF